MNCNKLFISMIFPQEHLKCSLHKNGHSYFSSLSIHERKGPCLLHSMNEPFILSRMALQILWGCCRWLWVMGILKEKSSIFRITSIYLQIFLTWDWKKPIHSTNINANPNLSTILVAQASNQRRGKQNSPSF